MSLGRQRFFLANPGKAVIAKENTTVKLDFIKIKNLEKLYFSKICH